MLREKREALQMKKLYLLAVSLALILGCSGLRYSQVSPAAKDFHPRRIGVLPVDVGTYGEARGIIDEVIGGVLVAKGWFNDVVAAGTINRQLQSNEELL